MYAELALETLQVSRVILRRHRGSYGRALLSCYLRCQLRRVGVTFRSGANIRTARILNYQVSFFSEEALAILIDEVFVQSPYIFQTSKSNPLIIDCGANIGMSIIFFKHFYPDSQIIAFEPDPPTFDVLQMNVAANQLSRVQLLNMAVQGVEGRIPLFDSVNRPGNLATTTPPGPTRLAT